MLRFAAGASGTAVVTKGAADPLHCGQSGDPNSPVPGALPVRVWSSGCLVAVLGEWSKASELRIPGT